MLDAIHPWGGRVRAYRPSGASAVVARDAWQIRAYFRLRQRIFCHEQGIFVESDRDAFDQRAVPIVAMCQIAGVDQEVVGVVRIYPEAPGTWFGGRLGVCASHRRVGAIGTALITCAVSTAHALGCQKFLATVQEKNVKYFERHDFHVLRSVDVQGRPHRLMEARLHSYPPELSSGPIFASKMGVLPRADPHRAA